MVEITRRDCVVIVSGIALPTTAKRGSADTEQSQDYVNYMNVMDEVPHFPHPDEGNIIRQNGKFLYIDVKEDTSPDPENCWVETQQGEHSPLVYPKLLWEDKEVKHTMWVPAEKIDDNIKKKPFHVDHGLLFKVQENPNKLELYIDNSEQEIPDRIKNNFKQPQPDFTVSNIDYSHENKSSKVSIKVKNNRSVEKTFRACVNIKEPVRSTNL